MARRLALAGAACALLVLGGCATGPNANPRDPFEPFNRQMMRINEGVDAVLLKPAATAYRQAIPPLVRTGVSNFFGNLSDVWSFVNSALQFKLQNAAENFMRVNVNTFFGLGGILDIASELNIERHREDFGQTLGRWGMPAGPYLVLPLLGPSTMRDALAFPIDRRGDLVHYLDPVSHRNGLYVLRLVDVRANLLRVGDVISGAALDKYTFTRDAHLQRRRAEIFEGGDAPPEPRSEADDPSPVAGTPEAVLGAPPETAGQPQPEPAR
ncbi:MAG: VacJ family lipoprotein [Burkholderiales bacterium]|nr:VacJ family lipoprotein [Burkholderiales bacterium]